MGQAAARARAERINFHIIGTYAARRALIGVGMGERVPAGAAHSAMELVHLTEVQPQHGGSGKPRVVDITRPGFRTARRRLPAVLARLDERDARRVAAENYALASEKVGSMAGASAEGSKTDGGAATNDGGVTTRIEYAGKGALKRALAKPDVFSGTVKGIAGVWQRPKRGKRRTKHGAQMGRTGTVGARKGLKLLAAYEKSVKYSPRLKFVPRAHKLASREIGPAIARHLGQAVRTAR